MERIVVLFLFLSYGANPCWAYLPEHLEDGLEAYWRMENNFLDYRGLHNGSGQGGLTYTSEGRIGGAYEFNGIDGFFDVSNASGSLKNLSEGSISVWFRFNDPRLTKFRPLFYLGNGDTDNTDSVVIEIGHPGYDYLTNVYCTVSAAEYPPTWCFDSNGNLSAGDWHHFVATVDSSGNTGYLDGAELINRDYNFGSSLSSNFFDDITDAGVLAIGYGMYVVNHEFYYFNGTIDEVGIWNRSLSSAEAIELYSWTLDMSSSTSTTTSTTTTSSTTTTIPVECSLAGDYPPCGEVTLSEVVSHINLWSSGEANLADVIALINAWSTS